MRHLLDEHLLQLGELLQLDRHGLRHLLELPRQELRREDRLGEHVEGLGDVLLQRVHLVDNRLSRRGGRRGRADRLRASHHRDGRHALRRLERHVLEEVGGAADGVVHAARVDVHADRRAGGDEVGGRHLQPVAQHCDLRRRRADKRGGGAVDLQRDREGVQLLRGAPNMARRPRRDGAAGRSHTVGAADHLGKRGKKRGGGCR
mmetsp:Transcript_23662/g.50123  ORF Transcript_23662/g.50123 Transcript_23662/m.50123 type:complete len:204 (+) Transcript_23662:1254-1865(+)